MDHTPQPGRTPDKADTLEPNKVPRAAFPDFHAEIHWQAADGDLVTTFKTYYGTHAGEFFGIAPTGRSIHFETVDVMRVVDGKVTEHWGVANLFSLMEQLGAEFNILSPTNANCHFRRATCALCEWSASRDLRAPLSRVQRVVT
ncbi:ester cyclase [Streptomyces mirabilis]|uniref:ester cyclase n=1 Tax=Streptomyces mirabilis TaxID=68239 RepID=UPI0036913793